jgi:hypothetical protein
MAKEIAERFQRQLDDIPRRTQALAALQWGVFYGLSCAEVMWSRTADGWTIDSLESVHSRRLAYPDPSSWDAHIWDLGTVSYWGPPSQTSNLVGLGVRIDDYPGKFILHHANLRGDYPTREGLGREIGFWLVLKGMAARGAAEYIERFAKPWATSYYSTGKDGHPRVADDDDIAIADRALRGLGAGGLAYANLPDSVKLDLQGPGFSSGQGGVAHLPYMAFVDTQIAIAALGQADTTKAGPNGSRAAVETRKEGSKELYRYDASGLGQSLRDGMAVPWTHLNYAGLERLTPIIRVHVDEQPAPSAILELATKAAAFNIPIDANAMPERLGLPGIDPDDEKARPMVPIKLADWHDAAGEEPEPAAVALPGQQPGQQLNGAAPQEPPANDVTADPNEDGTEDPLAAE